MADAVVASGETASGLTVSSGNSLTVESAGTAIDTTIDGGGVMVVS
jgi:autotransporter passenger strand-loop-strand repeat protein